MFPPPRAADDALYWIGRTADLYLSDPRQSLAAYRSVLRHYPESPRVAESQFRLAELYETRFSDDRRALDEYRRVLIHGPEGEFAARARFQMAGCRFRLGDVDRARGMGEIRPGFSRQSARPRALYLIGRAYVVKGEPEEATRVFGDLLERYPEAELEMEIRYQLAACLEEQGKLDEALGRYREIRDRYPNPEAIKVKIAGLERRIATAGADDGDGLRVDLRSL